MTMTADIHTHRTDATDAIISVTPGFDSFRPDTLYSAGIHPWHTPVEPETIELLERRLQLPQVVAIGECGLDALRGAPLQEQTPLFIRQAEMAIALRKPLIIHCVRCFNQLSYIRKSLPGADTIAWIIHGFRGKPQLAVQLARAGFYLSFGEHANPEAAREIIGHYPARFLLETDESSLPVESIGAAISPDAVNISRHNLSKILKGHESN